MNLSNYLTSIIYLSFIGFNAQAETISLKEGFTIECAIGYQKSNTQLVTNSESKNTWKFLPASGVVVFSTGDFWDSNLGIYSGEYEATGQVLKLSTDRSSHVQLNYIQRSSGEGDSNRLFQLQVWRDRTATFNFVRLNHKSDAIIRNRDYGFHNCIFTGISDPDEWSKTRR